MAERAGNNKVAHELSRAIQKNFSDVPTNVMDSHHGDETACNDRLNSQAVEEKCNMAELQISSSDQCCSGSNTADGPVLLKCLTNLKADGRQTNTCSSYESCVSECLEKRCNSCESVGTPVQLDTLPIELITHICSFLSANFVATVLAMVSRRLADLLTDVTFWKSRFRTRWPTVKFPAIDVDEGDQLNWQKICTSVERQYAMWSNHETSLVHHCYRHEIYASVDVTHLLPEYGLLAVGSRDKYLNVIDVGKLDTEDESSQKQAKVLSKMDAHDGWIWSMSSHDGVLATGSWDRTIKFWDMQVGVQQIRKVACRSAILCTHYEQNFFVAGSFNNKVYHIDPRTSTIIATKTYHSQPVLALAVDDMYVITGSEDGSVCAYDRRGGRLYKTVILETFPMAMSYNGDELWLGDKKGAIQLIDTSHGRFQHVDTFHVGHTSKVTGVIRSPGSLVTCSTDHSIRISTPTAPPRKISCLEGLNAEVARIDYQNDILTGACSDSSVRIWMPRDKGGDIW